MYRLSELTVSAITSPAARLLESLAISSRMGMRPLMERALYWGGRFLTHNTRGWRAVDLDTMKQ